MDRRRFGVLLTGIAVLVGVLLLIRSPSSSERPARVERSESFELPPSIRGDDSTPLERVGVHPADTASESPRRASAVAPVRVRGTVLGKRGPVEGLRVSVKPVWVLRFAGPPAVVKSCTFTALTDARGEFQVEVPRDVLTSGMAFVHVAASDRSVTFLESVYCVLGDVVLHVKELDDPDWSIRGSVRVHGPARAPIRVLAMFNELDPRRSTDWQPVAMAEVVDGTLELRGIIGAVRDTPGRVGVFLSDSTGAPLASRVFADIRELGSSLAKGWEFEVSEWDVDISSASPADRSHVRLGFPIDSGFTGLVDVGEVVGNRIRLVGESGAEFRVEWRSTEQAMTRSVGRWVCGSPRIDWAYHLPATRQQAVRVVRSDGVTPVPKASVSFVAEGDLADCFLHQGRVFTDESGRATLALIDGLGYALDVGPPVGWQADYAHHPLRIGTSGVDDEIVVPVAPGANVMFDIFHRPPPTEPVRWVHMLARREAGSWAETKLGFPYTSYASTLEAGRWHFVVFSAGQFCDRWIDIIGDSGEQRVAFDLSPAVHVEARVTGGPWLPGELTVTAGAELDGFGCPPWSSVRIATDGTFELWLTDPSSRELVFWKNGHAVARRPIPGPGEVIRLDG